MSPPFLISTPVPWIAAAAQTMIAMEMMPPRPMERQESRVAEPRSSSGLFHFLAAEDAWR
jgi:hypothetical protein